MKKLFFALTSLLIIFYSCSDNQDSGFKIEGEFDNAENEKIYLSKVKNNQLFHIDSLKLSNDGGFGFSGELENTRFFYLGQPSKKNMIQLIVAPGEDISVTADINNLSKSYTVSGSEGSQKLKKIFEKIYTTQSSMDSINRAIKNISAKGKDDAQKMISQRKQKMQDLRNEFTGFSRNFAEENTNSLASLVALNNLKPYKKYSALYRKVDSTLRAKYPNNQQVKSFHEYIQNNQRQNQAQTKRNKDLSKGSVPPDIALPNPEGDTKRLSSLKGKYVLLDFWASWCAPCRKESPNLVKNYNKYSDQGFDIFQVSLDKGREDWIKAIKEDNIGEWHHVYDKNKSIAKLYNIKQIPTNYLLNRDGEIIAKNLRGNNLEKKLEEIFSN